MINFSVKMNKYLSRQRRPEEENWLRQRLKKTQETLQNVFKISFSLVSGYIFYLCTLKCDLWLDFILIIVLNTCYANSVAQIYHEKHVKMQNRQIY